MKLSGILAYICKMSNPMILKLGSCSLDPKVLYIIQLMFFLQYL